MLLRAAEADGCTDAGRSTATPFTYRAAYPGIGKPLKRALARRGMRPSLTKDPRCVFEFSQRTKACFERAHAHTLVTSNIFVHRGLADKARLATLLAGKRCHPNPTYTVRGHDDLIDLLGKREPSDRDEGPWCLKAATVNNSLGVAFFPSLSNLAQRADEFFQRVRDETYILQPYVKDTVLYRKKKCHVRLNILVVGPAGHVYVHNEPVLHVAPLEYGAAADDGYENAGVHVTNHVAHQHTKTGSGAGVVADRVTLADMEKDLGCPGFASDAFRKMCGAVREIFQSVVGKGNEFLPVENCFELFGVDFLFERTAGGGLSVETDEATSSHFEAIVLEVNSGPGLEGRVDEALCEAILEDTLRIVLDPWHNYVLQGELDANTKTTPTPDCPAGYTYIGAFFEKHEHAEANANNGTSESPFLVSDTFLRHAHKVLKWTKTLEDTD